VQTFPPTQITEHPLPRWIRHAPLCSLFVWGMALMAGTGTIVRVVDQYLGEPLVAFSVMELDALGSHQSVRPRGASGSGLTLERC
jgi:hypothetical protein